MTVLLPHHGQTVRGVWSAALMSFGVGLTDANSGSSRRIANGHRYGTQAELPHAVMGVDRLLGTRP